MRCMSTAAVALTMIALSGSALAGAAEVETFGQFLVSMPSRMTDPIIDHCAENVPEIRGDLLEERAVFVVKLAEAGKPLMERFKNDAEFNAPVEESIRQKVLDDASRAVDMLKQQDPNVTCRTVLGNIQGATVDALRKVSEDNYRYLLGVAGVKNAE